MQEACRYAAAKNTGRRSMPGITIAVNLSARQFAQRDLVEQISAILQDTKLDPARLTLEITESVLMDDADDAVKRLRTLKALGVQIAIDDFGTGYSSLAYLKRFPVDVIKIDRSFVTGLGTSTEDAAIVSLIVALGRILGMQVVAEGVESAEQAALLQAMGCTRGQGYFYGRPTTPESLVEVTPVAT